MPLHDEISKSEVHLSDLIVLHVLGGHVKGGSAYRLQDAGRPSVPEVRVRATRGLLLWEVLDSLGKVRRWPEPDSYCELLASIMATAGEPLSERLSDIGGSGSRLTVRSLGGGTSTSPDLS